MLKDEILSILERKTGDVVTGGQLANALHVSRTAIWKAIHTLQEEGVQVVSVPNVGYKLLDTNDTISRQIISEKLTTKFIGRQLAILPSVHSTNQYLKEMDGGDVRSESGFVVVANEQTKGRGRRSREFVSRRDEGIYMSILLRPDMRRQDIRLLTICAAVAVSKAIESCCGLEAGIKWVNDVYIGGKKICGILTEAVLSGEMQELDTVIIGIGINTGEVPFEIREFATSIRAENGMRAVRNALIAGVLNSFEEIYAAYSENCDAAEILEQYDSRLFIKGRQVTVISGAEEYTATVIGIDSAGGLVIKCASGDVRHIVTGEIKLR